MATLSPFLVIIVIFVAMLTALLLKNTLQIHNSNSRYGTIDGLRGFLALFVFIHHSSVWHQFLHTGKWDLLQSNLYNHLGQTSVSFFFMITSFLFISKIIKHDKFDFKLFLVNRIFRLVPMYFVALILILIIIFLISKFKLKVSLLVLGVSIIKWLTFTVIYSPINNYYLTNIVNAGVNWSLPYEWLFYFFLPILGIIFQKKIINIYYIFLSIIFGVVFFKYNSFVIYHFLSFLGGGIIAVVAQKYRSKFIYLDILTVICFILILQFNTNNNYYCIILSTIIFGLIALGNSLFGILNLGILKFLGEISYSTYLLHGIILFVVFNLILDLDTVKNYSEFKYSCLIVLITPLVILFSLLGYKYVEKPFIEYFKKNNK